MSSKPRDYILEGELSSRLMNESNARPEDLDDIWLPEIRAGLLTRENYAEKIAQWKEVAPHRFVGMAPSDEHTAFAHDAWVLGRATSQAQFVKKFGIEEAKRQATLCGNPFDGTPGSIGKPGKAPIDDSEAGKKLAKDRSTNPWNPEPSLGFVGPDGRYSKKAIEAQRLMVKGLGFPAAAAAARVFDRTPGDSGPNTKTLFSKGRAA